MASQSLTDAGETRTAADPSDPGARLLVRVGDFVEPLTRFDRNHLSMTESRHDVVNVMIRQVFRVAFERREAEGNGALPGGVREVADAAALARESEAQMAAARIALPLRLAAWAQVHGGDPGARPSVDTCFSSVEALGYVEPCGPCGATGRIACTLCKGEKRLTCDACSGHGATACQTCSNAGTVTCKACRGMGTVIEQKQRKKWDDAADAHYVEHYQDVQTCPTCNKLGIVKCPKCAGRGELTCRICDGRKTVPCSQCRGTGATRCEVCGGEGKRFHTTTLDCSIRETFEIAPRTGDSEIAATLKARGTLDRILQIASTHRATAEASKDTLTRDTMAATMVTSVMIAIGEQRAMIRAYGAAQEVLDYKNIAGILMSDDISAVEAANAATQRFPPRVDAGVFTALSVALESEANVEIAMTGGRREAAETERNYRGVITAGYVKRAEAAIRKGVGRAYWAGIWAGPAAVIAMPVLFAPVDLFLRNSGVGARIGVLLFIMAATFGGALLGHFLVVHALQRKIGPHGVPRMGRMAAAMGLSPLWLITAGAAAVLLTLLIAGMTSWLIPPL